MGKEIRSIVLQWTGIPTSIGIAKTKTLSKGNPLDPEKAAKDQVEDPKLETKEDTTPKKKN